MFSIPQSTSFVLVFKAYLSSDHVSEATGKTIAITISKAGGAFGNPNAGATNATEISSGWYKVTLDTTDTATLGIIAIRGTAATIDDVGDRLFVVKATNGGLTALPDAVAGASGGVPLSVDASGRVDVLKINGTSQTARDIGASVLLSSGSGTGQLDFTAGVVKANATQWLGGTIPAVNVTGVPLVDLKYTLGTISPAAAGSVRADAVTGAVGSVSGNVGGNVSGSVASVSGLTAADVGAIKTQTDKLAFTVANQIDANVLDWKSSAAPAMTGDAFARLGAPAGASVSADVAAVKVDTAAVKLKTDNLPSDPADASDIAGAFSTVNSTLATIAGYVDTEVAAIKAKTDLIPGTTDGKTFAQLVTLFASVLLGKASGLATTTAIYRAVDDSKDRVTATVDADGDRTAVTLDAS